ncbi:MAG: cysteine desulfurase family protein [Acidobacteriota bacterium]
MPKQQVDAQRNGDAPRGEAVYLDNNATTPVDPRVVEAMLPWFTGSHGNPSSAHAAGRAARGGVEHARAQVAALLGAEAEDILFVSSGSEANNMVIETFRDGHLVITALEHPSVRAAAGRAAERGLEVTELSPGEDGRVDPSAVADALRPDTRLVCLMQANNELGTLQPVTEVAALCQARGVAVLTDAVQAVGKVPVDVGALGVDYLTLGGHKFHGPLGVGALWVRPGAPLRPLLLGAPQEHGRRASTENVPAIVGLGATAELARLELEDRHRHLASLRDRFEARVQERLDDVWIHCADAPRLPHTSHIAFLGVVGLELSRRLDTMGFATSIGAACHSGAPEPSRVVLALGVERAQALASLRVSFGMTNTLDEVDAFVDALEVAVGALRSAVSA